MYRVRTNYTVGKVPRRVRRRSRSRDGRRSHLWRSPSRPDSGSVLVDRGSSGRPSASRSIESQTKPAEPDSFRPPPPASDTAARLASDPVSSTRGVGHATQRQHERRTDTSHTRAKKHVRRTLCPLCSSADGSLMPSSSLLAASRVGFVALLLAAAAPVCESYSLSPTLSTRAQAHSGARSHARTSPVGIRLVDEPPEPNPNDSLGVDFTFDATTITAILGFAIAFNFFVLANL